MYHLKLTCGTADENIAVDEQLLAAASLGHLPGETLRLWEAPAACVVMGRSSPESEIHWSACRAEGVEVLRRSSGGATVVLGPGCLMYAVVLDLARRPELRLVDRAHQFVLSRHAAALAALDPRVARAGLSDLVLDDRRGPLRKFSGNSLRIKRTHVLYHGTILYDYPIERIGRWLADPIRRPEYRGPRGHAQFLVNFPATRDELESALIDAWEADEPLAWPVDSVLP